MSENKTTVVDPRKIKLDFLQKSQEAGEKALNQDDGREAMHWSQTAINLAQAASIAGAL